jgi:protein FRA10AC1
MYVSISDFKCCKPAESSTAQFALRWRTEDEVLNGNGETTCGNTRCDFHDIPERLAHLKPSLTTLELPFAYVERGENKSALVKIVLCPRCLKKLMWKRRKEKETALAGEPSINALDPGNIVTPANQEVKVEEVDVLVGDNRSAQDHHFIDGEERRHPKRSSRSRSPRRNHTTAKRPRRRYDD